MIIDVDELLQMNLKDEVFVIETDTVYGLGCLYNSEAGAERIMEIKKRSASKNFCVLVSNLDQTKDLATNSDEVMPLLKKYWPGAVTFIFKKSIKVKDFVTKLDTVGLRMPDDSITLKVIDKFGPLIMTSLNNSGEPPVVKFEDTKAFENEVDFIVKGRDLNSLPSTIYDAENKKVLRQGSVTIEN